MDSSVKANVMENQLRQKVIQFENSLARISDTRKHLRDNADLVKNEIRATFGTQLTQLRRREQQLLEALDMVVSVKDGILSQQQDQLHQALGACAQGLEWYETAVEDMQENRLVSIATVEQHINDVLKKLSVIEVKPRENAALSFEADTLAIRKAISSFGHVRTGAATTKKSFESLPAHLEDYEDEDVVHSLLHKAVNRGGGGKNNNTTTIVVGRPKLSSDPKDWLLREALTGRHSAPLEHSSVLYTKHCTTTAARGADQGQHVHSWLHHIKDQVEYEPNIFEDFEIVKDHEVKNSMHQQCDTIKAELSGDVTALFRHYFQTVLMSPSSQWLLKSMEKTDNNLGMENMAVSAFDDDMDVMTVASNQSTMTYESSSGEMPEVVTANSRLVEETYSELWQEFVRQLWNSTDSLWLLPCCSDADKQPQAALVGGDDATTVQREQANSNDLIARLISDRMKNVSLNNQKPQHHQQIQNQNHKLHEIDQWLLKPANDRDQVGGPLFRRGQQDHQPPSSNSYEEWLGWKRLVQRIHSMGDQYWLYRQPMRGAENSQPSESGPNTAMEFQ